MGPHNRAHLYYHETLLGNTGDDCHQIHSDFDSV